MKKTVSLILVLVMCLSLCACRQNKSTATSSSSTTVVTLGDSITLDFMQMQLDEVQHIERLCIPYNTRGDAIIMSEYAEGKTNIVLSGKIKNTHTEDIGGTYTSSQCVWGDVCLDDKYHYDIDIGIINGENMYGEISPLSTADFYIFAQVPVEALESASKITLTFGFIENLRSVDMSYKNGFSFDKCSYKYSVAIKG